MNRLKADAQKIALYIFLITLITALILLLFFSENKNGAINGELDFRSNKKIYTGINKLNGEWKVVFDQFLSPDTDPKDIQNFKLHNVPGNWNKLHKREGYATYLLKIKIPDSNEKLLMIMPTVSTAYKLFINGELASTNGIVGKSISESFPQYHYEVIDLVDNQGTINLIIHVSNYHYNKGGLWNSPSIGTASKIKFQFQAMIFTSTLITGGLGLVGLSLMVLFIIKRKFKAYKNLGLFCLFVALRTLLVGEVPITQFFPSFPWTLLIRIEYLTMSLGFIAFNSYFFNLYEKYYKLWVYRVFVIFSLIYSGIILVTPVIMFTSFLIYMQIIMISGILNIYVLFYLSRKEMKEENSILLFGFTIIQLMVVIDILLANNIINFNPFEFNTSVGLLIFIFCNAIILMKIAVKTTENLEQLTHGLEKIVQLRTKELEEVNRELFDKSITDKLTGINNRHEYTRVMKYEDARYKRTGKHYASLYLDLDNFKFINDNYGHSAGDFVLKRFTSILKICSRDSDYLFRMGGDEFHILMTEINSLEDASKLADRVQAELKNIEYFTSDLKAYTKKDIKYPAEKKLSVTIGISCTETSDIESLQDLLVQSDLALIEAKSLGKNQIGYYKKQNEN